MMKKFFFLLIGTVLCCACKNDHFLTDQSYREEVHSDFLMRQELAVNRNNELFSVFNRETLSQEEKEALEFLYAYMPLSDLADYDGDFFLRQVQYAFKARNEFAWGATIPEEIFRHFVLVYRVNNENLDTARMLIFNELKDRIENMSMYEAALEVNHWCHEKVAYTPSDSRTSAPLATIRTAWGRCGEESTLAVTAMRACGIPARQCYTPRWAHTDDNHAWVEVWVDGKWYFLGACEPDPELDMGWFAIPSTRTMMVHSNVFGKYSGKEEVNKRSPLFSCVNMLPNYTQTKKIKVKVVDNENNSVSNATVKFKLYNYAEYYPLAAIETDADGIAQLTTGYGDLLVWASKENQYAYAKFAVRDKDEIILTIDNTAGKEYVELFEMVPPDAVNNKKNVPEEKTKENARRLQFEDSLRNAYTQTFITEDDAKKIVNENLTPEEVAYFLKKSEGNYAEIILFLNEFSQRNDNIDLKGFLSALSDKDLRDTPAEILKNHITLISDYIPENKTNTTIRDVYTRGILPARISNELIRPWRTFLKEKMAAEIGENPTTSKLANWITENIEVLPDDNYYRCPISPRGVFDLRKSDIHSRDIFFIAACRALAIPAYMDNATGLLYAYENGDWQTIYFEQPEEKNLKTGTLVLNYPKTLPYKPEYWIHYTIAKFENGDFVTFDYENDPRVANFPVTLELETGYYMLSTGTRYSDGTVLSRLEFFNLDADQTLKKTIIIRDLEPRNKEYGQIDLASKITVGNQELNLTELMSKDEVVLCFIDPSREPTKHLLKDLSAHKTQFESWNGNLLLIVPSSKNSVDFDMTKWNLPKNTRLSIDNDSNFMNTVLQKIGQMFNEEYPLIFIVDKEGKITFKSEGYRIGTGELIYKSL